MLETKVSITRAVFTRVDPGEPPSVALYKILTRPDGKRKHVSLSVPIRDGHLLARVEQELQDGDEIEVTVETRWADEGIPHTLLDFSKVSIPPKQAGRDQPLLAVR